MPTLIGVWGVGCAIPHSCKASQAQSGLRRTPQQEHEHKANSEGLKPLDNKPTKENRKRKPPKEHETPSQPLPRSTPQLSTRVDHKLFVLDKNLFVFWVSLIFVFLQSSLGPQKLPRVLGDGQSIPFGCLLFGFGGFLWEGWNSLFVKNSRWVF